LSKFMSVETLGFDYGQRHRVELDVRGTVLAALRDRFPAWAPQLGQDHRGMRVARPRLGAA
jgi:7-cyano-7-deazaguanine synthase